LIEKSSTIDEAMGNNAIKVSLVLNVVIVVLLAVLLASRSQFSFFGKAATGVPCGLLTSSTPVSPGWGASYNLFSAEHELILKAFCNSDNVVIEAGTGKPEQYIYKTGYMWKGQERVELTFSGQTSEFPDWFSGSAQATAQMTPAELKSINSASAYICEWRPDGWKCGCSDNVCSASLWNLQQFTYDGIPPTPSAFPLTSGTPTPCPVVSPTYYPLPSGAAATPTPAGGALSPTSVAVGTLSPTSIPGGTINPCGGVSPTYYPLPSGAATSPTPSAALFASPTPAALR